MISIKALNENAARMDIVGEIGWETSAEYFRWQANQLIAAGQRDLHIYINSEGGDVFDATEIVNIMRRFNSVTGEVGAFIASAATYIVASFASSFTMPDNSLAMIHRPYSRVYGNVTKIEAELEGLRKVDEIYLNTYLSVMSDKTWFTEEWNKGVDIWMTAKEAKSYGLIADVTDQITIDAKSRQRIAACGCPGVMNAADNISNNLKKWFL